MNYNYSFILVISWKEENLYFAAKIELINYEYCNYANFLSKEINYQL